MCGRIRRFNVFLQGNFSCAAADLRDLRTPPGNRLEKLKGEWEDFYSIRINDQWRLVFRWSDGQAYEVRITDYH